MSGIEIRPLQGREILTTHLSGYARRNLVGILPTLLNWSLSATKKFEF